MKSLSMLIALFALVVGVVFYAGPVAHAALNPIKDKPIQGSEVVSNNGTGDAGFVKFIGQVISAILFFLGILAVLAIIIGGFRYVTSNGDAGNTKTAKDTILYAVIGLIVAILAYAIVNFVLSYFK